MGAYTDIVDIVAPASASAGETVPVTIKIKNIWTASVHVYAVGVANTEDRFIDWLSYWIPAGATHSFPGAFVMPDRDVTIHAYSYYEAEDGYLYFDDEADKDVSLTAVPESEFRNISIYSIEPSEAEIGDTVRITARVEHRGAEDVAAIYAAIGVQGVWFDEILHGEKAWSFPESTGWEAWLPYADIVVTSAIAQGVYDAYVKVKAPLLVSPTVYDCVTIIGVPTEPEFRGFALAEYTKR